MESGLPGRFPISERAGADPAYWAFRGSVDICRGGRLRCEKDRRTVWGRRLRQSGDLFVKPVFFGDQKEEVAGQAGNDDKIIR